MLSAIGPEISVVIPTYERPDLLGACLAALAGQDLDRDRYEVVVIDDASPSGTGPVLERFSDGWPQLRWKIQPENRGPATARNRGVAESAAPLILFIDDDIVAPPGLVRQHIELHAGGDESLGVVGLVDWHPDLMITPFMKWLDTTDFQFAYHTSLKEGPVVPPWTALYTCNISVARAMFEGAGGFDERFRYAAYEDVELGIRMARHGFHLDYRPAAFAWHNRPTTLEEFCRRMRKVGESAVLFSRVQEEVPADLSYDDPAREVRSRAIKEVLVRVPALKHSARLMDSHYRTQINKYLRQGLKAGQVPAQS
jgi:GT2 family glycosyltransferase